MQPHKLVSYPVLQVSEEATGEFDPVGTLVTLILLVLFAYGARWMWQRSEGTDGTRNRGWQVGALLLAGLAIIVLAAFAMNLMAALGMA